MNHQPVNDMQETQSSLEQQILEATRQVELGREEACEELNSSRIVLREAAEECGQQIETLAEDASEDLLRLQRRLGELNYLLAEESDFDSLQNFESLQIRIEEAAKTALNDLHAVTRQGRSWKTSEARIKHAWNQFSSRMRLVEAHLRNAIESASEEFSDERRRVAADLRTLGSDTSDPGAVQRGLDELAGAYTWFKGALKAVFVHPDEAAPSDDKKD